MQRLSGRDDRGETLVELMMAIAIIGIAAVAILGGLILSIKTSTVHRNEATGGAYVRSWAEQIQNSIDNSPGLPGCGGAETAYVAVGQAMINNDPALSGFTAELSTDSASGQNFKVMSWTGSGWGACTAEAIQRVRLTLTTSGDSSRRATETLTVVLRPPCNGPATALGSNPCL